MILLTKEEYKGSKTKKTKKKKKTTAIILISFILISIAVLCVLSLTVFFKAESFEISGSKTYTDDQIISVSGIELGDNLIRIPIGDASESIRTKLPFISSVEIERSFPSTVKITVKETKEEILISNGKKLYSADLSGKILKEYKVSAPDSLILFTVSTKTELREGYKISFENERESELFENYIELIKTKKFKVNFVNTADSFDSYVKLEDRMIVLFGSSSYFDEKLSYLESGYSKIPSNSTGIFDLSSWTPESNTPRFRPQSIEGYEK